MTRSAVPGRDYIGVGGGAIIVNDRNEVLLVRRASNAIIDAGMWSRPGGKIEIGETAINGVEREVFEETNIRVRVTQNLGYTETIAPGNSQHWIALSFAARYISGEVKNLEPDKHDEVRWFPLTDLPPNLTEYTKESIQKCLEQQDQRMTH